MSSQSSLLTLGRHMALKESSPFNLVIDSISQSAHYLVMDIIQKADVSVVLLAYETAIKPAWATHFLDCHEKQILDIANFIQQNTAKNEKSVIIIDSLNYVPLEDLSSFISQILLPYNTTLGIFHSNCPQLHIQNYPDQLHLLSYIALAIFHVEVMNSEDEEEQANSLNRLVLPIHSNLNLRFFKLTLITRRKSGRSVTHKFFYDKNKADYDILKEQAPQEMTDEDNILKDLSTFNLDTSDKQKLAREQVELPFMEAQQELGLMGGAIVYQFEKDDDYDEEDPYEDPF